MIRFVFTHVTPDRFAEGGARHIVELLLARADQEGAWDVSVLLDQVQDEPLKRAIADMVFSRYELSRGWATMGTATEEPDPWKIAERCLLIFRRMEIDDLIAENQRQMKAASARGEVVKPFLEQHQALLAEKKQLDTPAEPSS